MFDDLGVSFDSVCPSGSTPGYSGRVVVMERTLVVEAATGSETFDDLGSEYSGRLVVMERTLVVEAATGSETFDDLGSAEYSGRVVVTEAWLVVEALDRGRREKTLLRVSVAKDLASLDIF
jgi:hypothetical protein